MSLDNKTENDVLLMFLKGIDPAYRIGATQYIALITGDAPDEANPLTNECTYTGYERQPITKATGWTDNGSSFNNAVVITFGARSDAGATQIATYFMIVDTADGAINMGIIGQLSTPLAISQNIQPIFAIGDLEVMAE